MTDWLLGLAGMGPWGPVLFVVLYVVTALALGPAIVLTLTAGALWGLWWGSVMVAIGATCGAIAAYGLSYRLSRFRALAWLDRNPRVAAVRAAVADQGPWIQFLLRLSPIVPFTWLNYALGLSRVPFRDFMLALTGMIPTIVLYTYYGKVAGDVTTLVAGIGPPRGVVYYVLLGVGLVTTIVATASISRAARQAIDRQSRSTTRSR